MIAPFKVIIIFLVLAYAYLIVPIVDAISRVPRNFVLKHFGYDKLMFLKDPPLITIVLDEKANSISV